MQLKHIPYCLFIVASICLAGAVTASAQPPGAAVEAGVQQGSN